MSWRSATFTVTGVERLSYVCFRGFFFFSTLLHNFTGISSEFRRNVELEYLKKGDSHNSAFSQTPVR